MDKYEISQIFREIGTILELIDKNPKKAIAYRKAAQSIESAQNLDLLAKNKTLQTLPGIGQKMSEMIAILLKTHELPYYSQLKKNIPESLLELVLIPGLTLKKIRILYEQLKISSISELKKALETKKLIGIKGFSPFFIKKLKKRTDIFLAKGHALLYPRALFVAQAFASALKGTTKKFSIAGSLRRKMEIISELSFVAISSKPKACLNAFINHSFVHHIVSHNQTSATVMLKQGIKASLQLVNSKAFAMALMHATGSNAHLKKLFKLENVINARSEKMIYASLGLNFIPPELREGYGEVTAAKQSDFSDLIKEEEIKGVFHCHTVDSDGHNTIEEMALAARNLGWEYLGISDHSKSSYQANGLSEERLSAQINKIKHLKISKFRVFSGIECDILKDGQLDVSDFLLKQLDFVIVSVHSLFKQEKKMMTRRLIKAIENPYTTIVGHLTGRLIGMREPYKMDLPRVIDACIANHKVIEINCCPNRLDMDWRYWLKAKDRGLKCSINPDAHSIKELQFVQYGVNIARKSRLRKEDVINALPLKEMELFLIQK